MSGCSNVRHLMPVRLLREDDTVWVRYLDPRSNVALDAERPVEVLRSVTANDDFTTVEIVEGAMVTVRQIAENGDTHTIALSPRMAIELAQLLNSFMLLPPTE
jgi:hypothetical protein